ncbi:MAG: hypothetical protein WDZ75_01250 [Candidatus Paceibacterota bacterium]
MQNNKTVTIGVIILLLLVLGVGYLLFTRDSGNEVFIEDEAGFASVSGDENNSIIVNDQIPGGTVFFQNLTLESDGFVVVRSDNDGQPGDVMGSLFVEAGEDQTGNVELNTQTLEGGVYYAELYEDSDANGSFDEALDTPVVTAGGSAVRVQIETTENLPEIKG